MKATRAICVYAVAVLIAVFFGGVRGDQEDDPERAQILAEVKSILEESDEFRAIEFVNGQGDPEMVANRYFDLVIDFYWQEGSLPEVVTFARAGIQYALSKAQELPPEEAEGASKLRSIAKAMAYNLASFTWPGWDQEGIVVSERDLATGLDAAKLNLRLAHELSKPTSAVSAAHWVLGAQYLAAAHYSEAVEAFTMAREKAHQADDEASEWMNHGYIGMARIIEGSAKKEGEKALSEAIDGLEKVNTEDARFYTAQLKSVLEFFSK